MVLIVILAGVFLSVICQYYNKLLLLEESAGKVMRIMYWISALIILAFILVRGDFNFYPLVSSVAFIVAVAVWFFNRAVKIGLTQSILILPLTAIVSVVLSVIFLGEFYLLNPASLNGIISILGVLGILAASVCFAGVSGGIALERRQWMRLIFLYILISGSTGFLIKYFAMENVSIGDYLISWYLGASMSPFLPSFLEKSWQLKIKHTQILSYILLSVTVIGAMWAYYLALTLAPATIVLPVHSFLFTIGTVLVGLFVFHEKEKFTKMDWAGLVVGFVGVFLLLIGLR